ncbi:(d)CMP kinase [Candidatus Poribacteria bacterium]|nr:(d)CMP kinase [Candidatus Poribacteria bacterium]
MTADQASHVVVAIDGPAAAGKSTVARGLAEKLGFVHLNSGALYRGVTLLALRTGVRLDDESRLEVLARDAEMGFTLDGRFLLNGVDESAAIRTPEVDTAVSRVSIWRRVRAEVTRHQRRIASLADVVIEGRDTTTVVFPNAQVKFFLSASVEERARRRYAELVAKGESASLDEIAAEIRERDQRDETRHESPLRVADDAVVVDSTSLPADEIVSQMARTVAERITSK